MSSQELKVTERDTTLNPRQLRAAGFVPATVYGKGMENQHVQVRAHEFTQLYMQGVREFKLTGFLTATAVAKRIQRDPVKQTPIAVEFHQVGTQAGGKKNKAAAKSETPAEAPSEAEPVLA